MLNYGAPLVHALIDISLQRLPAVIVSTWSDVSHRVILALNVILPVRLKIKSIHHHSHCTFLDQSVSIYLF